MHFNFLVHLIIEQFKISRDLDRIARSPYLEHLHHESSNYSILPSQNLFYHLYNTILQYTQYLNFYFLILLIIIIYLHNKIYFFLFCFFPIFSSHAYVPSLNL